MLTVDTAVTAPNSCLNLLLLLLLLPFFSPQFMVNEMAFPPEGQDGKPKRGYMATPEDTYYNLAQYYDIPTLSFR